MGVYGSMIIDIVNEELGNQIFKEFDEIVNESISISSVIDKIKQLLRKFKEFVKKMIGKFISLIKKDKKSVSDYTKKYKSDLQKAKTQKSEEKDKVDLYNMKFDEIEISYYNFYDDDLDIFNFRVMLQMGQCVDTEKWVVTSTEYNNNSAKKLDKMYDEYFDFDPESRLEIETIASYSAYEKVRNKLIHLTDECSCYATDMNGTLEYFLKLSTACIDIAEKTVDTIEKMDYDPQIVSAYIASVRNLVQVLNKGINTFGSACTKFSKAIKYNMESLTTLTNHFIKMTKSQ